MKRLVVLSSLALACGAAPTADTGLLPASDAGLGVDAGAISDAGLKRDSGLMDAGVTDAGARDAGAPLPNRRRRASLTLERDTLAGTVMLEAIFIEEPLSTPTCVPSVVGNCTITDCPSAGTAVFANAGVLSVFIRDAGFDISPLRGNFYQASTGLPFIPGAIARVDGSGGTVPSFSVEQPLPQVLAVEESGCGLFGCEPISADAGLTLQWDGGGSEEVFVSISEQRLSAIGIECRFGGATGTGEIGPSILSRLQFGNVMIELGTARRLNTDAGVFPMEVVFKSARRHPRTLLP